jgi:hypothetical protein
MTAHRSVIAQFCDDVRQEIGNKFSLMGCYGSDLYVPAFPITMQARHLSGRAGSR